MDGVKREVLDNGVEIEYSFYSEKGQDFRFYVSVDHELEDVRAYANNFDIDDEVEVWLPYRGTRGVPATITELFDNAKSIKSKLLQIVEALEKEQ